MCIYVLDFAMKIRLNSTLKPQIIEEIDALQIKLNERTDKLNAMKKRHNELTQTVSETETHLKQVSVNSNTTCHRQRTFSMSLF